MAIHKMGVVVVGIRGTLGGLLFSANSHGNYCRAWSKPANVRSTLQSTQRATLSQFASEWRNIDAGDRADWDTFAADPLQKLTNALGIDYYISGFLWYVRMSTWLRTVGRAQITTAPVLAKPVAPAIIELQVSAGASTSFISYLANTFDPDYDCTIEMTIGPSIGAVAQPIKPLLLIGKQTPAGISLTFDTELAARFGSVVVGQKAWANIYRQNLEGYRSAPTSMSIDVEA